MFDFTSENGLSMIAHAQQLAREYQHSAIHIAKKLRLAFSDVDASVLAMAQTLAANRDKATFLGEWATQGLFTSQMLQQCSHPALSNIHAARFSNAEHVVEVCTGAGVDAVALAKRVGSVDSYDLDPEVVEFTKHNLHVQGVNNVRVHCKDPTQMSIKPKALWSDPSRRAGAKRLINPEMYSPRLSVLDSMSANGLTGVKIAPACDIPEGWCGEYTGVGWQCQELVIWKNCELPTVTAIVAHDDGSYTRWIPPRNDARGIEPLPVEALVGSTLVEPHPCVVRTNTLAMAFAEENLYGIDTSIAFGVSRETHPNIRLPHRLYSIVDVTSADFSAVNTFIRSHQLDSGTQIKKRGFHLESQIIRKKLKFVRSGRPGILLFTRSGSRRICLLLQKVGKSNS